MTLRIGTRGSPLALWQAHFVAGELRAAGHAVEFVEITTSGDVIRDVPLSQLGGLGAFTREIQKALQTRQVDIAVHSLKDLPTFAVDNLVLAAVPPRGPVGDAFLSLRHRSFEELPPGAVVATSSLRRRAQILHRRPDLKLVDMRGNVDTRLRKLREQELDAIILAEAGLKRLGLASSITEILDPHWLLPAVGQGALGLECRADDAATRAALTTLDDPTTHQAVLAERALLRGLGGGCQVPIAAITTVNGDELHLRGAVLSPEGTQRIEEAAGGRLSEGEALGLRLAEKLLERGAREVLGG